jgi:hypothetical protein
MGFKVIHKGQHPLKHKSQEISYQNVGYPVVQNVKTGLDTAFTLIAGGLNWKAPVATPADLPLVGNSLNDARIVANDGDGKRALYVCIATVGTLPQQWLKISDPDWGLTTLDIAYDGHSGAGSGKLITADSGAVQINASGAGGALILDGNNAEMLLVRKLGDSGDVFSVNTVVPGINVLGGVTVDNGLTNGGRYYFDGGTTKYLGSSADGATLYESGFTTFEIGNDVYINGGSLSVGFPPIPTVVIYGTKQWTTLTGYNYGLGITAQADPASASAATLIGADISAENIYSGVGDFTGTVTGATIYGKHSALGSIPSVIGLATGADSEGDVLDMMGISAYTYIANGKTDTEQTIISAESYNEGAVTTFYAFKYSNGDSGGTYVNKYGLYIDAISGATALNYAIYTAGGDTYFNEGTLTAIKGGAASISSSVVPATAKIFNNNPLPDLIHIPIGLFVESAPVSSLAVGVYMLGNNYSTDFIDGKYIAKDEVSTITANNVVTFGTTNIAISNITESDSWDYITISGTTNGKDGMYPVDSVVGSAVTLKDLSGGNPGFNPGDSVIASYTSARASFGDASSNSVYCIQGRVGGSGLVVEGFAEATGSLSRFESNIATYSGSMIYIDNAGTGYAIESLKGNVHIAAGNIECHGNFNSGVIGGSSGALLLNGSTSGVVTVTVGVAAGTYTLTLPNSNGDPSQFLQTDGDGNLSWASITYPVPTTITVADESTDTLCYPIFVTAATGDLEPKTNAKLFYDSLYGTLNIQGGGGSPSLTSPSLTNTVNVFNNNGMSDTIHFPLGLYVESCPASPMAIGLLLGGSPSYSTDFADGKFITKDEATLVTGTNELTFSVTDIAASNITGVAGFDLVIIAGTSNNKDGMYLPVGAVGAVVTITDLAGGAPGLNPTDNIVASFFSMRVSLGDASGSSAIFMQGKTVGHAISVQGYGTGSSDLVEMIANDVTFTGDVLSLDNKGTGYALNIVNGDVLFGTSRFLTSGTIATAANDMTLVDANYFIVSGNTQINAITTAGWQAGSTLGLIFTGTPTVKNNTAGGAGTAKILLEGGRDLVCAANTTLYLAYDGTQWQEISHKSPSTAGSILGSMLQNTPTDLGAANVTINLSNSNGSYVTNLTIDGAFSTDNITVTGSHTYDVTTASGATYQTDGTEFIIHCTYSTTGTQAITLDTDELVSGRMLVIKDTAGGAATFPITISTEGAEKIDGQDTYVINVNYGSVTLYSNGTHWFVV